MGLYSSKISSKSLVPACHSLANTYHAGIPIIRGLELAADHTRDRRLKKIFAKMASDIKHDGATLGQAAQAHKKYLPEFFIQLLSAGEVGGQLDVMLRDLASYYEDRLRIKREVIGGMTLPILYLFAAWYLGTFALGIIGKIDVGSTAAFDLGAYFRAYLLFQAKAHCVFLALIVISVILARLGLLTYITSLVKTYIWPLSPITRRYALARFFRSFALLTASGVNVKQCLLGASATIANPYIQKDIEQALPHIENGATLTQAFAVTKSLTPVAREMLFVGEQSGNIDGALLKVAEYHQEEANHAVQVGNKILFVLVMLLVGGVIGYIVITFYTSLWSSMDI